MSGNSSGLDKLIVGLATTVLVADSIISPFLVGDTIYSYFGPSLLIDYTIFNDSLPAVAIEHVVAGLGVAYFPIKKYFSKN